jgi:hypothetical protein
MLVGCFFGLGCIPRTIRRWLYLNRNVKISSVNIKIDTLFSAFIHQCKKLRLDGIGYTVDPWYLWEYHSKETALEEKL